MWSSRVRIIVIVFIAAAIINDNNALIQHQEVAKQLGVSANNSVFLKFYDFLRFYNKTYESSVLVERFNVFKNNLIQIKKLNEADSGTAVYGITPFTDLTTDEFMSRFGSTITRERRPNPHRPDPSPKNSQTRKKIKSGFKKLTIGKPPRICDWRKAKPPIVTPIRDQGSCGSCWIFSTIAVLESQYQLRKRLKKQLRFSEQQILDCSDKKYTCTTGGNAEIAISTIKNKLKSKITALRVYPYLNEGILPYSETGKGKCVRDKKPNYKFSNLEDNDFNNYPGKKKGDDMETFMARYVAERGPIVAFILFALAQHYKGGIVKTSTCSFTSEEKEELLRGHFLAVVGFARYKKKNLPYWIMKNSWGTDAEDTTEGYMYMARGQNMCNVTLQLTAVSMSPDIHPQYKKAGCPRRTSPTIRKPKRKN